MFLRTLLKYYYSHTCANIIQFHDKNNFQKILVKYGKHFNEMLEMEISQVTFLQLYSTVFSCISFSRSFMWFKIGVLYSSEISQLVRIKLEASPSIIWFNHHIRKIEVSIYAHPAKMIGKFMELSANNMW